MSSIVMGLPPTSSSASGLQEPEDGPVFESKTSVISSPHLTHTGAWPVILASLDSGRAKVSRLGDERKRCAAANATVCTAPRTFGDSLFPLEGYRRSPAPRSICEGVVDRRVRDNLACRRGDEAARDRCRSGPSRAGRTGTMVQAASGPHGSAVSSSHGCSRNRVSCTCGRRPGSEAAPGRHCVPYK